MTRKYTRIYIFIALMYSLLSSAAWGQRIVSVDVDSVACIGDSVRVGVGYRQQNEVVVENLITAISHPGRVFLPDGKPCGALGCSYRSPVTFTGFPNDAQISTANDINFIRLNIEHSWIGDLYINITCPNGQYASLMNWRGTGQSSCDEMVPTGHRSWSSGNNTSGGTYFGIPIDGEATNKCDSTHPDNAPGTGWNYCWSSNTVNGYGYASGDAKIYRSANVHSNRVDSSNTVAHTNFYHPDDNFSALIGCPVNGEWYIEVLDAYSGDNGWIFDWELSLNPALIPQAGYVVDRNVIGSQVTEVNDSLYYVSAPDGASGDTVVTYIARITSSTGSVIDTTFTVHYYPHSYTLMQQVLCEGDSMMWRGHMLREATHVFDTVASPNGCLTITELELTVNPTYAIRDTFEMCYNSPIYHYNGQGFMAPGHFVLPYTTVDGCDSLYYLLLGLIDSGFYSDPLLSDDGENWRRQRMPGADSVLVGCAPFRVWFKNSNPMCDSTYWNLGDDTRWIAANSGDHTYDSAGIYTVSFVSVSPNGCRDTVVRQQAVWVFEPPVASFSWDPQFPVLSHPQAQFYNESMPSDIEHFDWVFSTTGTQDSSHEANPYFSWAREGENVFGDFDVTLSVTHYNPGPYNISFSCMDDTSATVTIINDWLQFPNLVTPNGDGVNDRWEVVNLLECGLYTMNELWIYDAWGVLAYHVRDLHDASQFWDPDATNSPDGTYYFRFSAQSPFGMVRFNGMIEVMRK